MSIFRLIAYDVRCSFRQNRVKWLFALAIQLFLCVRTFSELSFHGGPWDLLSALWPVMSGAREYELSQDSSFQLPAYWFSFHAYLLFLTGFYPVNELYLGNGQALVRTYARGKWLMSKIISAVLNISVYYGSFLAFGMIGNLLSGGEWIPRNGIIPFAGVPIWDKSLWELCAAFVVLPWLVSVSLCTVQIVLSIFMDPVIAFMVNIGGLAASVFWRNPFLPGNYAMLYRQDWVCSRPGISLASGVALCLGLTAAAAALGAIFFQKKDIL